MSGRIRTTRALLVALVALLAAALLPSAASARTVWLCLPGHTPDPCALPLSATVVGPTGAVRAIEPRSIPAHPPIDCFYVYPTVSDQPTPAANLNIDPAEIQVAHIQTSRYSLDCRVFAPMYRQITLAGLGQIGQVPGGLFGNGYSDVRSAFFDFLAHYSHGRGFVLIGHSQGSIVLRHLITNEIDNKPSLRRRLVSAILPGGNVLVRSGSNIGVDFQHIPGCRSASQAGCIIAYSSFSQPPSTSGGFGHVGTPGEQVLCTNPAALGGGSGLLRPYAPAATFPGMIGLNKTDFPALPTTFTTPWVGIAGSYSARCETLNGATVLEVSGIAGAPTPKQTEGVGWGLHVDDMNLALGNLVDLVRSQTAAFLHH